MSIQELSQKFKHLGTRAEILLALLIVVVSLASFYLGRVSVAHTKQTTHSILQTASISEAPQIAEIEEVIPTIQESKDTASIETTVSESARYVGSKNGTKYHLPWCAGAKQIKEENKVWFASKEEAEKVGYTPASNCKGI